MRMLMLGLLLCAGSIVLYDAAVLGRALWRGSQVAADSQAFETMPESPRRALLVVGDSTAVGTGAQSPGQSIAGRIAADFSATRIDNLGVNGALTRAVAEQLARAPLDAYDAVLIQVGGNDALQFTGRERLAADIAQALQSASRLSSRIALMSTGDLGAAPAIPWPVDGLFSWRSRIVREVFSAAARRDGARYVDLFVPPGQSNPFLRQPDVYHARDGLHPSGAGYGAWYEKLRAQVPLDDWLRDGRAAAATAPGA